MLIKLKFHVKTWAALQQKCVARKNFYGKESESPRKKTCTETRENIRRDEERHETNYGDHWKQVGDSAKIRSYIYLLNSRNQTFVSTKVDLKYHSKHQLWSQEGLWLRPFRLPGLIVGPHGRPSRKLVGEGEPRVDPFSKENSEANAAGNDCFAILNMP